MSFNRLGKVRFEKRIEALNTIGNTTVGKVQQSKKDKANDPRKQRKRKDWTKGWD